MSSSSATASAPGKILWIGGYSVLEKGNASLVTAVDKRVEATAFEKREAGGRSEVTLVSEEFDYELTGHFEEDEGKLVFDSAPPEAKFVSAAAQVSLSYLHAKKFELKHFKLATFSDEVFGAGKEKSGLGSSAAVTAAAVGAVICLHAGEFSHALLHNLSQIAHSLAQGKVGSGFDVACACFGSCEYLRYSPELVSSLGERPSPQKIAELADSKWDYSAKPVSFPKEFRMLYARVVGRPASTTEMVRKVVAWKAGQPAAYNKLIGELNQANEKTISALERKDLPEFRRQFVAGRELTKRLGEESGAAIEPPEFTELIEASEANGAFVAKLPGAGGGDGIAAICLGEAEREKLEQFWESCGKPKLQVLEVDFGKHGLQVDKH